MAKEKKEKKGFFHEFKEFITRGNVLDMAVGVIIGGAFTAIVNALSNNILKPIINWILVLMLGANSLDEIYTMLKPSKLPDGTIDLANSIYIDWGAFINAIINFLLIALVLFLIVKAINKINAMGKKVKESAEAAAERRKAEHEAAQAAATAAGVMAEAAKSEAAAAPAPQETAQAAKPETAEVPAPEEKPAEAPKDGETK